ncbi:MAG TPA: OmpA family protein [Gemmatimonas sp.]|nr:OmpA family protein [Gemmatimonas sp.]
MLARRITFGAAMLIAALPAAAQQRGTLEMGGFVSSNTFDDALNMDNAIGFGGRFGAWFHPRWSVEFEGNGGTAGRPSGLADRSFRFLDGRVVAMPVKVGRFGVLLGGGVSHVDANVRNDFTDQAYGFHGLVGGKLAMSENVALRVDYTRYFNDGAQHGSLKGGVSLSLHPNKRAAVVAAPMHADSVSAAETRRLRAEAASYAALRDSLAKNRATAMTASNVAALATMLEMIHFERDASTLDDVSRAILNDKVAIFNANPEVKIVITGYASSPGTDAYNMALGFRRATAARAYLVSQGISQDRIEITTRGEENLVIAGPGEVANAANRRGQFRLLIADPYLMAPQR